MDAPEEPLPPVIYTMENKPIVTCECRSARAAAAAAAGSPVRARRPLVPRGPAPALPAGRFLDGGVAGRWLRRGLRPRRGRPPAPPERPSRRVSVPASRGPGRGRRAQGGGRGRAPAARRSGPRSAPGRRPASTVLPAEGRARRRGPGPRAPGRPRCSHTAAGARRRAGGRAFVLQRSVKWGTAQVTVSAALDARRRRRLPPGPAAASPDRTPRPAPLRFGR